ncbi:MAG: FHA domain-containing protein [Deltaproteobacteria bacterium]|nr:FHA domain-containing protein [Deltaproteobacteria bacterium]
MAKAAMRFRNLTTSRQPGELARLRVLAGPDHGTLFIVQGTRVSIGRGEDNDVVLTDMKSSRRHAEILLQPQGALVADIGSTHGISVNGKVFGGTAAGAARQLPLKTGDKIGVGESVLEFIATEAAGATRVFTVPPQPTVRAAGTGSSGYTQFIPKPRPEPAAEAREPAAKNTFFERNRKILYLIGALVIVATLLPSVEQKQRKKKAAYNEPAEIEAERAVSSIQPPQLDAASVKSSEQYFREGFREFRAGNFTRAKSAFETALQVNPGHPLAAVYLGNTTKAMEGEAKTLIDDARKDEEANRLSGARAKYDAVKRLYQRDTSNPRYKEAEVRSDELEKRIKEAEKN